MIEFDEYGFLKPYGSTAADLDTFERVFVEEFTSSTTRRNLFGRYREYNTQLLALLTGGFTQWIDGSFASRKNNPDDIDILTFVDADVYDRHEQLIEELKRTYRTQRPVFVDAYFVRVYSEEHRRFFDYQSNRVEWLHDWTRTVGRRPKNKGLIELKF